MIDADAAKVICKFAKEIEKRALPLGKWPDNVSPKESRGRNAAWLLLVKLQTFMKHVEESDLFLKLWQHARDTGKKREQESTRVLARQEDHGYAVALRDLEQTLRDIKAREQADPNAVEYGKELAKVKAARDAAVAKDKEEARVRRNARARERRAAEKATA